jgi:hypothetical protein
MGPFDIFILCEQIHTGMAKILIDTGAQVSLVKEGRLARGSGIRQDIHFVHGITGDFIQVKGQIDLSIRGMAIHAKYTPLTHFLC